MCPYFLSRTNGSKNYINCSKDKKIQNSERIEFDDVEDRKTYYENVCCSERFTECYQSQNFREG